MDMNKKKSGFAILSGVLTLTLGAGFAFAANPAPKASPEIIKEDIVVSNNFLPDPEVYSAYSAFGITISDDGKRLLYNGQSVKLFADEHSDAEAFYFDEAGTINLSVNRNGAGNITGVEKISENKAQAYYSAFFADDLNTASASKDTTDLNKKYEQYSAYGITPSADGEMLLYNGQHVKLLVDQFSSDTFETLWYDKAGTANLSIVRGSNGQITGIESISEEKAQGYLLAADEYEKHVLSGLEERIEKRMEKLYPGNKSVQ